MSNNSDSSFLPSHMMTQRFISSIHTLFKFWISLHNNNMEGIYASTNFKLQKNNNNQKQQSLRIPVL